jgi:predicted ribonuclease YlaK
MSIKPPEMKKMFVLDTNVLLHDPRAIFSFGDSIVGIPIAVLEELENFKKESSERGKALVILFVILMKCAKVDL